MIKKIEDRIFVAKCYSCKSFFEYEQEDITTEYVWEDVRKEGKKYSVVVCPECKIDNEHNTFFVKCSSCKTEMIMIKRPCHWCQLCGSINMEYF